jgi:hypothetical protein
LLPLALASVRSAMQHIIDLLGSIPIHKKEIIADKNGKTRKSVKNTTIKNTIKNSKINTESITDKDDSGNIDIQNGNIDENGSNIRKTVENGGINENLNGDNINDVRKSSIYNEENSNNVNMNINEDYAAKINDAYKNRIFSYCCELWCLYVTILSR